MFKRRRQHAPAQAQFADSIWRDAVNGQAVLRCLEEGERHRLHKLARRFCRDKDFLGAAGLVMEEGMKVQIAALACLPVLELGLDWYREWRSVIVYPGGFRVRHQEEDEAGIVHEFEEARSGEAWDQGPLVLSWEDIEDSADADGYNVVIHECSHKLDMLNGEANGFPPLHRQMSVEDWTRTFQTAYETVCESVDSDQDTGVLDPYAADSPAEFFAVASEAYFEIPGALRREHPELYAQLAGFYLQDPLARAGERG